jgi:hypothetical protein
MLFLLYVCCLAHVRPILSDVTGRQTAEPDILDWINPLIGSRSGGNVFAGATLPYGMAKGQSSFSIERTQPLIIPQLLPM